MASRERRSAPNARRTAARRPEAANKPGVATAAVSEWRQHWLCVLKPIFCSIANVTTLTGILLAEQKVGIKLHPSSMNAIVENPIDVMKPSRYIIASPGPSRMPKSARFYLLN
jgi:hypothetical protein